MSDYQKLLKDFHAELLLGLGHLQYSHNKIQTFPTAVQDFDEEILETWESYTARFARVSDIFLSKFIRIRIMMADPAFRGELRDFVNQAEKIGVITSSDKWMEIRELRNRIAHEYSQNDLSRLFIDIKSQTPFVISEISALPSNILRP